MFYLGRVILQPPISIAVLGAQLGLSQPRQFIIEQHKPPHSMPHFFKQVPLQLTALFNALKSADICKNNIKKKINNINFLFILDMIDL